MKELDYVCIVCDHRISESEFVTLSEDFVCPECGVPKSDYYLEDFGD